MHWAGKIYFRDHFISDHRFETFGLPPEIIHHLRAHSAFRVAGIIFHIVRDHQLAARLRAGIHQGFEAGARRVDGSGIAGGAGADNEAFDFFHNSGKSNISPGFGFIRFRDSAGLFEEFNGVVPI
mgnify:CR=1 FL=1